MISDTSPSRIFPWRPRVTSRIAIRWACVSFPAREGRYPCEGTNTSPFTSDRVRIRLCPASASAALGNLLRRVVQQEPELEEAGPVHETLAGRGAAARDQSMRRDPEHHGNIGIGRHQDIVVSAVMEAAEIGSHDHPRAEERMEDLVPAWYRSPREEPCERYGDRRRQSLPEIFGPETERHSRPDGMLARQVKDVVVIPASPGAIQGERAGRRSIPS